MHHDEIRRSPSSRNPKSTNGAGDLSGIVPIPILRRQLISDVCLPVVFRLTSNTATANHLCTVRECDSELKFAPGLLALPVCEHLHEVSHVGVISFGLGIELEVSRLVLIGEDGRPMIDYQLSEDESLCDNAHDDESHLLGSKHQGSRFLVPFLCFEDPRYYRHSHPHTIELSGVHSLQ